MAATPLKLTANDAEDLTIISACLQDEVTLATDITYLPKELRFAAVLSRFRWEDHYGDGKKRWVKSGVHFNGVLGVQSKDLRRAPDAVLELLAIEAKARDDGAAEVRLAFAGGSSIRLDVECIECNLLDMGEPWAGRRLPKHPIDKG